MNKLLVRISAAVSGISGLIILTGVFYPILSYKPPENIRRKSASSPVTNIDYTKASNWFSGGARQEAFVANSVKFYTISIPKLKIENATVAIGGEDLSKSLIQYPGTALPGKAGNSVIFGHSILPIFYDPKNYLAIFSTLPTLKPGDEIGINYDGVSFKFKVETLFEVLPTDLQVLEQNESDSFLTLVTCVPPGDPRKPKRLIIRARVIPPEEAYENTRN